MAKRLFTVLILVLAAAALVSAAPAKVTLQFWSGFTGPDRPVLEQIVKNFNDTSKTTTIEMSTMTWDVLDQKLTASFAAGSGPDFFNYGPEILGKYYNLGALTTVDGLYSSGMVSKSIFPKSVTAVPIIDGKNLAAPMCVFDIMIYYNKDMFAAAGIKTLPKNQDELFADAIKLTKKDAQGNVTGPARDFATGWLAGGSDAIGRPAGVTAGPDGALYVSDDKAGLIYRITYSGS